MTFDIKIRKWLWIVLIIVVVLGGSFTYWQVYGNKGIVTSKTSPTPKKSTTVSPAASATATPTSNKTGTPQPTATPNPSPTPTPTPPAGWKVDTDRVYMSRGIYKGAEYSMFIKNDWVSHNADSAPSIVMVYGNQSCSGFAQYADDNPNCYVKVSIGGAGQPNTFQVPDKDVYVTVYFLRNVTEAEQQIILNSFRAF